MLCIGIDLVCHTLIFMLPFTHLMLLPLLLEVCSLNIFYPLMYFLCFFNWPLSPYAVFDTKIWFICMILLINYVHMTVHATVFGNKSSEIYIISVHDWFEKLLSWTRLRGNTFSVFHKTCSCKSFFWLTGNEIPTELKDKIDLSALVALYQKVLTKSTSYSALQFHAYLVRSVLCIQSPAVFC